MGHLLQMKGTKSPCLREGMIAMKQKPRWMQSVIKAATQEQGPLPFGRRKAVPGKVRSRTSLTAFRMPASPVGMLYQVISGPS